LQVEGAFGRHQGALLLQLQGGEVRLVLGERDVDLAGQAQGGAAPFAVALRHASLSHGGALKVATFSVWSFSGATPARPARGRAPWARPRSRARRPPCGAAGGARRGA